MMLDSIKALDAAQLVERLRDKSLVIQHPERDRIADEIERLRTQNEWLGKMISEKNEALVKIRKALDRL